MRPGAAGIPRLHVTQRALLQLHSQIERRRTALPFGLLSGALCLAPETSTHYLLIDEAVAARRALTADEPLKHSAPSCGHSRRRRRVGQKLALGWYLGGMDGDLEVDPEVAALHRELFGEAWQIMLVSGRGVGCGAGRISAVRVPVRTILPHSVLRACCRRQRGVARLASRARWCDGRTIEPRSPSATSTHRPSRT